MSRPVEVHCLEGGLRMHIEFRVVSFEYVFNVCIWESRDWQNSVLFTLVLALHSPLPRSSFFFSEPRPTSQIKDAWEEIDLLFHNCFVDSDPR